MLRSRNSPCPEEQKFFGSFFQKRTLSLPLSHHAARKTHGETAFENAIAGRIID
jgi:hypothetical protein